MLRAMAVSIGYGAVVQRLRHFVQHNIRRAALLVCALVCLVIALGFLTGWGWVMVQTQFGAAAANLIVAGIYALIAAVFWIAARQGDTVASSLGDAPQTLVTSSSVRDETAPGGTALGAVGLVAVAGFVIARLLQREFRDRA